VNFLDSKIPEARPAMFSIQKFFSKDAHFCELLEQSAAEARASAQLLIDLLRDRKHAHPLDQFRLARSKDRRITERIREDLVTTFVTGMEREDIDALAYALYRIPKTIEKFAERFNLAPQRLQDVDFTQQMELIDRATATLCEMVGHLRRMPSLETMKMLSDRLQAVESEADDVLMRLLGEVYNGRCEPLQAMLVRDLYDLLEKVIDRCRDAGNVISHIVLKNA
jgi:uncharacterized protein Yka (UPF0111/DUF47 family)